MSAPTILRQRMLYSMRALLGGMLLLAPLWVQAQQQVEPPQQQAQQPQQAGGLSAADRKAISSYNFNEDNFKRLVDATREGNKEGIKPKQPDYSKVHSLDDLANLTANQDPRIPPLLQKYGFTPREYLLANLALMNAGIVVHAKSEPDGLQYVDKSRINPANVSFYEAHEAQIAALQNEMNKEQGDQEEQGQQGQQGQQRQ